MPCSYGAYQEPEKGGLPGQESAQGKCIAFDKLCDDNGSAAKWQSGCAADAAKEIEWRPAEKGV
jgi:hypothetical protein